MFLQIFWLLGILVILLFGFVVFFGAPYLPTLQRQTQTALDLLDLEPGNTLLELGCGDGKVMLAAAQRGLIVVGYELNPLLALIAYSRTWRYRKSVTVIWGNYWMREWPKSDGIFTFLLPKYMEQLNKKIIQYKHKPVKLVSYAFEVKSQKPIKQKDGLFLYEYC